MPFVNNWKKLVSKLKWVNTINIGISEEEKVIRNFILPELRYLLSNFDTDIPVDYTKEVNGNGDISYKIGPIEGVYFTRETDGESIPTSALFDWLNDGTSVKNIRIIGNYERESEPNSLNTRNVDNSDVIILASKKFHEDGIEPRNWTKILTAKHENKLESSFTNSILRFLRGK